MTLPEPAPQTLSRPAVADRFGRLKRKLRISLTDRCNFRCPYCMPDAPEFAARQDLLTRTELARLLRLFVTELGITSLRLTGGEPLLRRDLEHIVADCGALRDHGLERISLTTNGALLARRAAGPKAAGLDDLNLSLDALEPATFERLSGGASLQTVLDGVAAAQAAALPLKLNAVVLRGVNDDQILPLARFAAERGLVLRFIEFMPLDGGHNWSRERVVTQAEIVETLSREFELAPRPRDAEPALYFRSRSRTAGEAPPVGVISTVSNPFCASCDRLRVTADGTLYPCLFSRAGTPLRAALRAGATDAELAERIRLAVWHKDAGYASRPGYVERPIAMNTLGG
jgi:cyclic pyranopterin phosphate synthase